MVNFGLFYHQSWWKGKDEIPLPDLNYIRNESHKPNENAIDVFDSRVEAEKRRDYLNSKLASNQTGQYYVAPTTQETKVVQKRFSIRGSNIQSWK
ncbi:hypothetical protein E1630_11640 [Salmonella enterica subsp. enterica serovar Baguida]|nr:hypothetical protein [Salmonella enterica subsp. enterica serovar Baguida]